MIMAFGKLSPSEKWIFRSVRPVTGRASVASLKRGPRASRRHRDVHFDLLSVSQRKKYCWCYQASPRKLLHRELSNRPRFHFPSVPRNRDVQLFGKIIGGKFFIESIGRFCRFRFLREKKSTLSFWVNILSIKFQKNIYHRLRLSSAYLVIQLRASRTHRMTKIW